jgi:hypothetical protein
MDGLVYGAAVGIGFEIVENLLYSFSSEFSLELAVVRSISVGHILFTGFFGLMVGLAKIKGKGLLIGYGYIGAVLMHFVWNLLTGENWISYFILVPIFILTLKKIADAAWKYELEAYLSPQDEMEEKARRFITEREGASTATLAEELGLAPHRTALFMKTIGARFDPGQKKWFVNAVKTV